MKSCEIQRNGVTRAQFRAACRSALRKAGLDAWVDSINHELGTIDGMHSHMGVTEDHPYNEICRQKIDDVQFYLAPTPEARAEGFTGYNFIWEFTFDDEKTGHGYMFVSEF